MMSQTAREQAIRNHVSRLEKSGSRYHTEPGNRQAAAYIADVLKQLGYPVIRDYFTHRKKRYYNIIAGSDPAGWNRETYLLGAHFDSLALRGKRRLKRAPGADDNASGVAALLECAALVRDTQLDLDLAFVFFNIEEHRQEGSRHLARKLGRENRPLGGFINIDTIGDWSSPISRAAPVRYVSNDLSEPLLQLLKRYLPCPLAPAEELYRDDHVSFWNQGYMAVELTENRCTPYMHTAADTGEKLHYGNIASLTGALAVFFNCLGKKER